MTDLEWSAPPADPSAIEREPRKCKRHDWWKMMTDVIVTSERGIEPRTHGSIVCRRCGKVKDEAASIRGRRNKNRGNAIQRKRIEGLGGQNLAGNNPNLDGIGIAFRYESKSGSIFSDRLWRYLSGIPVVAGQTPVLIVTETPGPGRKARSYVVVTYDDWKALHQEESR